MVPEKRAELTTEGGLDVAAHHGLLEPVIQRLRDAGIRVSLFIDPERVQVAVAEALGADCVELHTGSYCDASIQDRDSELARLKAAANEAVTRSLECHAGHGLSFDTVVPVAAMPEVSELNIGHFLIGEAIFGGLDSSIRRMRALMDKARANASGRRSA